MFMFWWERFFGEGASPNLIDYAVGVFSPILLYINLSYSYSSVGMEPEKMRVGDQLIEGAHKKNLPPRGKAFTNLEQSKQDLAANVLKSFIPATPVIVAKSRFVSHPPFSYGDIPFYFGG